MYAQPLIRIETDASAQPAREPSPAAVIDVAHLHKAYGTTVAVDDVTLAVNSGEIFGILGRNGAGKTTTVECIAGLRTPDRGSITVLGLDPYRHGRELHERVGVQLQHSALPDRMRVREAVELYASFYRKPADGRELLATLGLETAREHYYGTGYPLRSPCGSWLHRGTAIASANAVIPIRSVMQNLPFGVDRGGRGMNCMWGVHKLSRPPARLPVGSFCMTAGVCSRSRGHQRRDLPASDPFGGTEVDSQYYGKLSGGQKQRLSIVLALIGSPRSRCSTSSPPALTLRPGATPGG